MELAALVIVNLVTATAMYFFFSLRFSAAVQKASRNIVLKELRENVEATVEYINTALDLMEEKNKTFYRMLRRSEELMARLEGMEREEKKPAKTRASAKKRTASKSERETGKPTGRIKMEMEPDPDLSDLEETPPHLRRLLDEEGARDRFESVSPPRNRDSGSYTSTQKTASRTGTASESPVGNLLGKIGDIFYQAMGGKKSPQSFPVPETVHRTESDTFQKILKESEKEQASAPPGSTLKENREKPVELPEGTFGVNQDGDHFDHVEETPGPSSYGTTEEKIRQFLKGASKSLPENWENSLDENPVPGTLSGFTEDLLADVNLPEAMSDGEATESEIDTEQDAAVLFRLMDSAEKKELVRQMAREGTEVPEIAKLTGLGPAEIELILLLPGNRKRPRTKRMVVD